MSHLGRTLGAIVVTLTLPAIAAAQLPPGPPTLAPGTGIIVGQVIDAATGRGVASAIVTLAGSRRVMTTTSGLRAGLHRREQLRVVQVGDGLEGRHASL